MIRKKVVLLGAFSVGKTSLVRRFVDGVFSDRYLTTVGVRIDKRLLDLDGVELTLLVWDLHGEDAFQRVRESYLRGSSGALLVADGTRPETVETALALEQRLFGVVGRVPTEFLVNKHDLAEAWPVPLDDLGARVPGHALHATSAASGAGVGEAFERLARRTLHPDGAGGP